MCIGQNLRQSHEFLVERALKWASFDGLSKDGTIFLHVCLLSYSAVFTMCSLKHVRYCCKGFRLLDSQIRYNNMYAKLSFFRSGFFFCPIDVLQYLKCFNTKVLWFFFLFWRGFINTHSDCTLEIAWNLHINSLPYFSFMATNGNTS